MHTRVCASRECVFEQLDVFNFRCCMHVLFDRSGNKFSSNKPTSVSSFCTPYPGMHTIYSCNRYLNMCLYIYPNRARGLVACIEIRPCTLVFRRCRFACPHAHLCLHLRTQCTYTHAVFRVRIQAVWLQRDSVCEKEGKRDDRHTSFMKYSTRTMQTLAKNSQQL